jgi:cytochrome c oxidase subunit 2
MTPIKTLLVLGLITGLAMYSVPTRAQADSTQVIKITASKFHFTPDHITLEKGQPVTLQLTSSDRVHGFMIRALKIDTDIKPGKVTEVTVTPQAAGTFTAICDHYCGLGHGNMKMKVVVEEASANAETAKALSASNTLSK